MTIEQLFFELLQAAIGNRKTLSKNPSADEWKELFALSKKQALTAIAFTGVTKL
jgi:acyl-CoA-binding protein